MSKSKWRLNGKSYLRTIKTSATDCVQAFGDNEKCRSRKKITAGPEHLLLSLFEQQEYRKSVELFLLIVDMDRNDLNNIP